MAEKEMRRYIITIIAATLAALFAGVSVHAQSREAMFHYDKLLQMNYDENGYGLPIQMTFEKATEIDGSVTRDGQYLFYASDRERGNFDIYLRELSGVTTVRVIAHSSKDFAPAVSPDGSSLAFVSQRDDPQGDIFVMSVNPRKIIDRAESLDSRSYDSDARNITELTDPERGSYYSIKDADPAWSPDGGSIVFSSMRGGGDLENLFLCGRSGRNLRQITKEGGIQPRFSEDGTKIIFVSYRDNAMGDIYSYDLATGTEIRLTSAPGIKLYPSYLGSTNDISYTLIDADTNGDKKINFSDRSIIVVQNIENGVSYPLTLRSSSSFRGRYFPIYKLPYSGSTDINYGGVFVYSEQSSDNINVCMMPEYGIIPKRKTAEEQYMLAEELSAEQDDAERTKLSYLRVFDYFNQNSDNESAVYIARAFTQAAMILRGQGDIVGAKALAKRLKTLSGRDSDYTSTKAAAIDALIDKKDVRAVFVRALSDGVSDQEISYLREDAADYLRSAGDSAGAAGLYESILRDDPMYQYRIQVLYDLGQIHLKSGNAIPDEFFNIFETGRPNMKDKVTLDIISMIGKEKDPQKRLNLVSSFRGQYIKKETTGPLVPIFAYAEGEAYEAMKNIQKAEERYKTALAALITSDILYYETCVKLGNIESLKGRSDGEESYLFLAATNYLTRWNRPNFSSVILKLISYYEKTGANYESVGKFSPAADLYFKYIQLCTIIHKMKKFENIYREYGPRAHVLHIDAYVSFKKRFFDGIRIIEGRYKQGLDEARINFDSAYLYGLGYIYAKKGAEQERLLDSNKTGYSDGMVVESYSAAQQQLSWAIFMSDTMVDPYILQGWINQAVDLKRTLSATQNDSNKMALYNKVFPSYLWERNVEVYEQGLAVNDEARYPEREGMIHLNLANTYFLLGNYPRALINYEQAARFKKSFSSKQEESLFRYHLSYCYWQTGKTKDAKREMLRVLDIYKLIASSGAGRKYADRIVVVYNYLALYDRELRNYRDAERWYDLVLTTASKRKVRIDKSRINLDLAWCALQRGDDVAASTAIARAESLLKKEKDEDQTYDLSLKIFGFGINLMDLGPDNAIIGESKLVSRLSTSQKKLLLYSMQEEQAMKRGNYKDVISALSSKVKVLKGKDTEADNDTMICALNGIGYSLYTLGRYAEAKDYFEKGWEFATKAKVNNMKGAFVSIKNLVSLYGTIIENNDVVDVKTRDDLFRLSQRIVKFRSIFLDIRFNALRMAIEEEAKAREIPVDPKKIDDAHLQAEREAQSIYSELDIANAVINFYWAELAPAVKVTDPLKSLDDQSSIRETYRKSADVFERSIDAVSQPSYKIKLLINAAVCRQRVGYAQRAYELFGTAEKIALGTKRDDLLWEIYYREALLMADHGNSLDENSLVTADKYFQKAEAIIESLPAVYGMSPRSLRLYRDHGRILLGGGDGKAALSVYLREYAVERISSAFREAPVLRDPRDVNDMNLYRKALLDFRNAKDEQSRFLESGGTDPQAAKLVKEKVDKYEKQFNAQVASTRARNPFLGALMAVDRRDVTLPQGKEVVLFENVNNTIIGWRIGLKTVFSKIHSGSLEKINPEDISDFINGDSGDETQRFVIMNDASRLLVRIPKIKLPRFTWAPSVAWVRQSGSGRDESPSVVRMLKETNDEADLLKYDIIATDNISVAEGLIQLRKIRPVILVASESSDVRRDREFAELVLSNGVRAVVFSSKRDPNGVAKSLRTSAGDISMIQDDPTLTVVGYNDNFVRGEDKTRVATYYDGAATTAMSRGDSGEMVLNTHRYEGVLERADPKAIMTRARAFEAADSPLAILEARDASEIGDSEEGAYYVYEVFNIGNCRDGEKVLNSQASRVVPIPELDFYRALLTAVKTGDTSLISIPDESFVNDGKLLLLANRYLELINEKTPQPTKEPEFPLSDSQILAAATYKMKDSVRTNDDTLRSLINIVMGNEIIPVTFAEQYLHRNDPRAPRIIKAAIDNGVTGSLRGDFLGKISLEEITSVTNVLDSLCVLHSFARGCREEGLFDEYSQALTLIVQIAQTNGFDYIATRALLDRAALECYQGKYDPASQTIGAIGRSVSDMGSLSVRYTLLSAEIAMFRGSVSKGEGILSEFTPLNQNDWVMKTLLLAHAERIKLVSKYFPRKVKAKDRAKEQAKKDVHMANALADPGFSVFEGNIRDALLGFDSSVVNGRDLFRKDLFENAVDFMTLHYALKKEEESALFGEEVKRQFDRWEITGIANEKLINDFSIKPFQQKLTEDSVALYITRKEEDVIAWVIDSKNITQVRIEDGYTESTDLAERFDLAAGQMQNVYGIAVELDDVLTPLLSKINGKKRIYIVTDRDMEQIPFEIAGKDRPLAERYSICYLPSLSITSSTVKLNGRTASVIGGSSDINSDLDRMALVHAGVFRNDGSTFAHLTIRPDILKGVLVSPVDGKSIPSLAPRRTALYLARGSEADYNSTLAQIAEREGFSMMIVAQPTVRDVNASIFAQYFYQRIAAGDDARDAFYAAMRMIIGHAKYGHPAYWVGMRLYYNGL